MQKWRRAMALFGWEMVGEKRGREGSVGMRKCLFVLEKK